MARLLKAVAGMPAAVNAAGTVIIDNTIDIKPAVPVQAEADSEGNTAQKADGKPAQSEAVKAEIELIKQHYREEGEKAVEEAKQRAQKIIAATQQQAQEYAEAAKKQAEELFEKSKQDGYSQGLDDGYKKGLLKCKDMLLEIKATSEAINAEKDELFASYETEIFDTVMEIVNRITLNSLGQKDKAVIKKTIKEAGKAFRNSDYVKVTLSGTDVTEEMTADADFFKKLFTNVKTVELEVLKDAPPGTVILDNGSEITDAGIMTQLKMIEELGKGKYRKAPSRRKKKAEEESASGVESEAQPDEQQSE